MAGCTAAPSSRTVQAGDTVAIPFAAEDGGVIINGNESVLGISELAYGGVRYEDRQRGELFIRATGNAEVAGEVVDFVTQYAIPGDPSKRSYLGAQGTGGSVVLIVDIPVATNPGLYTLALYHRATPTSPETEVTPVYSSELRVLPNQVTYNYLGIDYTITAKRFSEAYVGSNTKNNWRGAGLAQAPGNLMETNVIPDPGFKVGAMLDTPITGRPMSSATLEVRYPVGEVTISSVVSAAPSKDRFWFEDDLNGTVTIYGASMIPGRAIDDAWLNFKLLEGVDPVAEADFVVEIVQATDALGIPFDIAGTEPATPIQGPIR